MKIVIIVTKKSAENTLLYIKLQYSGSLGR